MGDVRNTTTTRGYPSRGKTIGKRLGKIKVNVKSAEAQHRTPTNQHFL